MSLWTKDMKSQMRFHCGLPGSKCFLHTSMILIWERKHVQDDPTEGGQLEFTLSLFKSTATRQPLIAMHSLISMQLLYCTLQLLNIYIISSTARHFTFISNPHNQTIKVSLPPVYSCKKTQKRALLKTIKLESPHLHEFTSLHLPTILTGQFLSRAFQTAGHNQSWNKPSGVYSFY